MFHARARVPGTVVITNPEAALIIRTAPGDSVDTSVVYYTGFCRQKERMEVARAAYDFGGRAFEFEDLPVALECDKGLTAGGDIFHIGANEPRVQFWHRLWQEKL